MGKELPCCYFCIFPKRISLCWSSSVSCSQQFPTVDQISSTGSSSVWSAKGRSHFVSCDDMWQAMTVKHIYLLVLTKVGAGFSRIIKKIGVQGEMSGKLGWTLTVGRWHCVCDTQVCHRLGSDLLWLATDTAQIEPGCSVCGALGTHPVPRHTLGMLQRQTGLCEDLFVPLLVH